MGGSRSLKDLCTEISVSSFVLTFTLRWCDRSKFYRNACNFELESAEKEEYCCTGRVSLRCFFFAHTLEGRMDTFKSIKILLEVSLLPSNVLF